MHDRQFLLITEEGKLRVNIAFTAGQLLAETCHLGDRQHTLEGGGALYQFARINVRWYRSIQHKRAIIGMHPKLSKEISHKPLYGQPFSLESR